MKVAFTYYPLYVRWNHGAAVLSAHCQAAGIETAIIPIGLKWEQKMNAFSPDYTCFSFVTKHDYQLARPFVDKAKGKKLAGGVYARKGAEIDGFLHVCRGEGEKLPDFLLNGDTTLFDTPQVEDYIDRLPDYSGVEGPEFRRGYKFLQGKRVIPYSHSRGCPYRCTFCEVRNLDMKVRIKNTIKSDLDMLSAWFDPDLFYFTDELLPYYHRKWRDQFAGNKHRFICMIRADIRPEHLLFLIENGMYACAFGVETGDEDFRNNCLKKGVKDSDITRTVAILQIYGIEYVPFFIENHPGETLDIKLKTEAMKKAIGGDIVMFPYEDLRG